MNKLLLEIQRRAELNRKEAVDHESDTDRAIAEVLEELAEIGGTISSALVSDTPRTDDEIMDAKVSDFGYGLVLADFARTLERENAELQRKVEEGHEFFEREKKGWIDAAKAQSVAYESAAIKIVELQDQLAESIADRNRWSEGVQRMSKDIERMIIDNEHWHVRVTQVTAERDSALAQLAESQAARLAAEQMVERMKKGLDAVTDLIAESHGVAGLHLNGDIATWDELRKGGRFDTWLIDFDEALSLQPPNESLLAEVTSVLEQLLPSWGDDPNAHSANVCCEISYGDLRSILSLLSKLSPKTEGGDAE